MHTSYVVLNGGLGNQLWQFAFAHKLAESGPVVVTQIKNEKVRNPHLENGAEILSQLISSCPHRITFKTYNFANPIVRSKFMPESKWSRVLPSRIIDSRRSDWHNFQDIDLSGQHIHLGFYQSLSFLNMEVKIVLMEMQALLSFQESVFYNDNKENYAIIHLRGGDYYQERHKNIFGVLDEHYYSKLAEEIIKYGFESAYVVTDDKYKMTNILKDIVKLELNYLDNFNEMSTMKAMSNAKIIGIANSSFSWWGGMLSKRNGGTMLAPYPWFKYQTESGEKSDLYESDIFKIPSSFLY